MKRFRYRLERVLQYRQLIKDEKRRVLKLAQQELGEARERLNFLEAESRVQRIAEQGTMTVDELLLVGRYVERLRVMIEFQREAIVRTEEKVAEALADYIEAAKEAESLVKHKDRKREEYIELSEKENQKFLDELTVQRLGRTAKIRASTES